MKKISFLFLFLMSLVSCKFENNTHLETPIIPRPDGMFPVPSSFHIDDKTIILLESEEAELENIAQNLKLMLDSIGSFQLKIQHLSEAKGLKNVILLSTKGASKRLDKGGYNLEVDRDKIVIKGQGSDGTFNGVTTLKQMILLHKVNATDNPLEIPNVRIWDEPRFQYRGMHLDVSRHFFPVSFVKKYLDIMALYKFNYFHWHLTDDQGWRIEIKQYPELTKKGAFRKEADGSIYGGFYTQEQIKEVVEYAKTLHIEVIPEIEMPGHSEAALACYPELSCSGKPNETPSLWGVFENVYCAGNDQTFEFLDNVLDEVMELFPSKYIHIGGDECPKTNWKKCNKCQKRMKEEGLANEHELQSYFIKRIEKYLNQHGKQIIGWDEILEGGLAPEATVMSWRGMEGGIDAAREEHDVIMTPTSYCYFDYYQAEAKYEPKAIGGYLPLSKVYAFNPIPDELNEEQSKFVIGGQANMWTEYMETEEHVEYMLLPRMLALSEVLWSKNDHRDFDDFKKRLQTHQKLLDYLGYNYSNGSYRLVAKAQYDTTDHQNKIYFTSEQYQPKIRYTLDGSMPNDSSQLYDEFISPKEDATITAAIFEKGEIQRYPSILNYVNHKGLGADIKFLKSPSKRYGKETNAGLLDGILGSDNFRDGLWTGFEAKDMIAEIEFRKPTDLQNLSFSYIKQDEAWILPPKSVRVYARKSGDPYEIVLEKNLTKLIQQKDGKYNLPLDLDFKDAVSIKLVVESYLKLPSSNPYAGNDCWLFLDELVIK